MATIQSSAAERRRARDRERKRREYRANKELINSRRREHYARHRMEERSKLNERRKRRREALDALGIEDVAPVKARKTNGQGRSSAVEDGPKLETISARFLSQPRESAGRANSDKCAEQVELNRRSAPVGHDWFHSDPSLHAVRRRSARSFLYAKGRLEECECIDGRRRRRSVPVRAAEDVIETDIGFQDSQRVLEESPRTKLPKMQREVKKPARSRLPKKNETPGGLKKERSERVEGIPTERARASEASGVCHVPQETRDERRKRLAKERQRRYRANKYATMDKLKKDKQMLEDSEPHRLPASGEPFSSPQSKTAFEIHPEEEEHAAAVIVSLAAGVLFRECNLSFPPSEC